jgi:hypothetical protein
VSGKKNKKTKSCWSEAAAGNTACRAEALEAKAGTLKPQSLRPAKPLNSDPRKAGFSILKKMVARGLNINQMMVIFHDSF